MDDCPNRCCTGADRELLEYEGTHAQEDLEAWLEEGPRVATQELIDVLVDEGIEGATVLDVGAGVGMVHVGLLEEGAARAVDVDASEEYLKAARGEAERRGLADRIDYHYGDLTAIAEDGRLPPAEVVTADAVICCYPYLPEFVRAVASVHPRLIGLTYPSDSWWSRSGMALMNLWWALARNPDRWRIHRRREVDRLFGEAGFEEIYWGGTRGWKVVVYRAVVDRAVTA